MRIIQVEKISLAFSFVIHKKKMIVCVRASGSEILQLRREIFMKFTFLWNKCCFVN